MTLLLQHGIVPTRHVGNEGGAVTHPPGTLPVMRNGAKSFHNNNNEASKKNPPPISPLVGGVDVLKEM
jgi:hypothetical protein